MKLIDYTGSYHQICKIYELCITQERKLCSGGISFSDKAPSEASFRGTEYLTIDLSKGDPVFSTQESISLQFKTRQSNGLLFYSGEYGVTSLKKSKIFTYDCNKKLIEKLQSLFFILYRTRR